MTGDPLLQRAADVPVVPASTTKVATAVAALTGLPGDLRLRTRVVAGAAPGEVVLVGGGDPTLAGPSTPVRYPQPARLADLAAQARAALGATAVTRVVVDDGLYTGERLAPGWKPTYVTEGAVAPVTALMVDGGRLRQGRGPRSQEPALQAGQAFASLLQPGAAVEVVRGTAAAGAAPLGEVASAPVPQLVERMLAASDNDLAEALARQVALETGRPASFAGAAEAVVEVLADAGVEAGAVRLSDGSGLSRDNRVEPAAVTGLLVAAVDGRGRPPGAAAHRAAGRRLRRHARPALPHRRGRARRRPRPGQDRDAERRQRAGRAAAHRRRPAAGLRPDVEHGAARRQPAGGAGARRARRPARGLRLPLTAPRPAGGPRA